MCQFCTTPANAHPLHNGKGSSYNLPRPKIWRDSSTDGGEVNKNLRHRSFIDPVDYLYLKYTTENEQANFIRGR